MKKLIKGLGMLGLVLLLTCAFTQSVFADTRLELNDTFVEGNIAKANGAATYYIEVPTTGYLTLTYQTIGLRYSSCKLMSMDEATTYYEFSTVDGSRDNPCTKSRAEYVLAGKYKIKVEANSSDQGAFRLKAAFAGITISEVEPNNGFDSAMILAEGVEVTGALTLGEENDFYKLTLDSTKTIGINFKTSIQCSQLVLYDKDWKELDKYWDYDANAANPVARFFEYKLDAGDYYLKVCHHSSGDSTNLYALSYHTVIKAQSVTVVAPKRVQVGDKVQLSAIVSPENAENKEVQWTYECGDYSGPGYVDDDGIFHADHVGKVKVIATSKDGSEVYGEADITITPRKFKNVRLKKQGKNYGLFFKKDYSSDNGAAKIEVCYSTSKSFKNAKTKKVGVYNGAIVKGIKKGKTYYVKIRGVGMYNIKGSWSKVIKFKAK